MRQDRKRASLVSDGERFSLRRRRLADVDEIVTWVSDEIENYAFTGSRLSWPLKSDGLVRLEAEGITPWVLVGPGDFDDPVGHFDLRHEDGALWLGRVIVRPALRGRGLSYVLVKQALEKARELGAGELRLNVAATNEAAIRTYLKSGFTFDEEHSGAAIASMRLLL